MTNKILTGICLLFLSIPAAMAQSEAKTQKEIDVQVWKPFHAAFEAGDAKALNALYADQVLRVTPSGVDTKNRFKQWNLKMMPHSKAQGTKTSLDFWFDTRQSTSDTSYEVGIFKITSEINGSKSVMYGQFHIVLKKINGTWKITQDWDSPNINGKPITEEDFKRKKPVQG